MEHCIAETGGPLQSQACGLAGTEGFWKPPSNTVNAGSKLSVSHWFRDIPCLIAVTISLASSALLVSKSYRLVSPSRSITNYYALSERS